MATDAEVTNHELLADSDGQTTAEYAVIISIITATIVLGIAALSGKIATHVQGIVDLFFS